MCLVEESRGGMGADEKVCIGMIVICPSTGDVVHDEFIGEHVHRLGWTSQSIIVFRRTHAHRN